MFNPIYIDFSTLDLDKQTLKIIEQLIDNIELCIDSSSQDCVNYIYTVKNDIIQLKNLKYKLDNKIIHANVKELKKSFKNDRNCVKNRTQESSSFHLLVFYAVECGLKGIYLKNNELPSTEKIRDQTLITKDGHNFKTWIKELRLPAAIVGKYPDIQVPSFRLDKGGADLDIGKAHQAWRYGVKINIDDEKKLVEWLEKVCNWIEEKIE